MIPKQLQLKNTIKYPTSIIIGGLNRLGFEIADSLIKQGGYVVIVDSVTPENIQKFDVFPDNAMISFLDYTSIPHLEEDIRRLDYVFYFNHYSADFRNQISTQEFLTVSNYLDAALSLASKFEARFLLTTSIKANQILFAEDNVAYNISMSKQYTQTYTNMEIQRYSEGLVMEYHEKAGLNVRIIRLGEIIGDGMDFQHESVFVQLITDAVKGRSLHLTSDGLEHEWYVHTLDAAYGIIKAQFAKDTEGNVFSVCYENTYTHLSVAYKIQELEENAGEIKFIEGRDVSPPVRIYKPAPNLSKIGWMHRISFDRGVVQSIAAAKISLLEQGANNMDDNEGLGKLKNFLSLAKSSSSIKNLSKSEQEEYLKRERLSQAHGSIKSRRKQRQKRFPERVRDIFWKVFTSLAGIFSFLKKMSPVEFGVFTIVMILFIILYVTVLSPLLFITRHTLSVSPEYTKSQEYLKDGDYKNLHDSAEKIENSIESIQTSINRLEFAAKIVSYSDEVRQINSMLDHYKLYAEGIKNMSFAIEPFNEYLEAFENNTQTRNSSEGFLSVSDSGLNLQSLLTEIKNREIYFNKGVEQYSRAIEAIQSNTLPQIPSIFADKFRDINADIVNSQSDLSESLKVYKAMPEILGYNQPVTYLLLALDNTRLTSVGGDIAAFALVSVQNGSITDINVQTTDNLVVPASTITDELLRQVNARRFSYKNVQNFKIEHISSVDDIDTFGTLAGELWSQISNKSVDNTIILTLESFEAAFGTLEGEGYVINGVDFSQGPVLQNLSRSLEANESVTAKRNIVGQIFALIINESLNQWKESHTTIESLISRELDNNNLTIIPSTNKIKELVEGTNADISRLYNTDTYMSVGMTMEDPKVVLIDRFPDISISLETVIDEFYNIDNTATITFPVTGSSREISVCLPDQVRLGSISIDESTIPQSRTRINIAGNSVCVVAQALTEGQFRFTWRTDSLWAPESENVSIDLGVGAVKGARTELDHIVRVPRGVSLTVNDQLIDSTSYGVKYQISTDEIINLKLSK